MNRIVLIIAAIALCLDISSAQSKLNAKTGLIYAHYADETELDPKPVHIGHTYGFDAIVVNHRFVFMPGFHYQRIAIASEPNPGDAFESRENFHQVYLPISFGVTLLDIGILKVRPYAGLHGQFTIAVDKDNAQDLTTDHLTGVQTGYQLGVHGSLGLFTVDLLYAEAFKELVKARKDSRRRNFTISLGIAI